MPFYEEKKKEIASDVPKKVICLCSWCGSRFGGDVSGKCAMYCKFCKTAEARRELKAENDEIFRKFREGK